MKTIILVAAHKPAWMPDDPVYLPLHVGAEGKPSLAFARDDRGDQISRKNPNYCELTGLYWAWKNLPSDALGLAHYRRHFARRGLGGKRSRILRSDEIEALLSRCDVLLPAPRHYLIETNWSQYAHAHHEQDLRCTREILEARYPAYLAAFDRVMRRTWGHRFNMFIMRRALADAYCAFLFDVLSCLEQRLDLSGYSPNDARVFGFVGERLLDVWLEQNAVPYRDVPYVFLGKQNWLRKGGAFLCRKFLPRHTQSA